MRLGDMIIEHDAEGRAQFRIVCIETNLDAIWLGNLGFATQQGGSRRAYCPQPKVKSLKEVQDKILKADWSCAAFKSPAEWNWTDQDFEAPDLSILRRERRQRLKWKIKRDEAFALIEPLASKYSIDEILEQRLHTRWPATRAAGIGLKSSRDIYSALHKFISGLGNKNALLPSYSRCGNAGKQKYFASPPGQLAGGCIPGFNTDLKARLKIGLGWKRYKNRDTSVRIAYHRFLNEHYASEVNWVDGKMVATLLPPGCYPSIDQFKEWGPRQIGNLSAKSVNAGETAHRTRAALRSGQTRTSVLAIGVLGQIDTTPCDQNLVSEASRLKILRTPNKAEVVDSLLGYVCGIHVGFEHPCTTTNLLAILSSATSKVEFCAKYGIVIKEEQWLSLNFRRFLADNGEMKSEPGMLSIEEMESSLEFCESYFGERKAVVESSNRRGHVHNDHLIPGSNLGRQTQRGEKPPGLDACFTFQEYMPRLIESILYRNNEEIIKHPMIEMRKDGVRPVRIEMMKWCIDKGYVASMPTDIDALRVRCLPRFQAVLHADGVHIFDPTISQERLIPGLVYKSQWLDQSGALKRALSRTKRLEAHINPSNLREIWINLDGLKALHIQNRDPYMQEVTLYDWLTITRDDTLIQRLSNHQDLQYHVGRAATIDHVAKKAKKEKQQESTAQSTKPSKASQLMGKRQNTIDEMRAQGLFPRVNSLSAPIAEPAAQVAPVSVSTSNDKRILSNPIQDMLRRIRQGQAS